MGREQGRAVWTAGLLPSPGTPHPLSAQAAASVRPPPLSPHDGRPAGQGRLWARAGLSRGSGGWRRASQRPGTPGTAPRHRAEGAGRPGEGQRGALAWRPPGRGAGCTGSWTFGVGQASTAGTGAAGGSQTWGTRATLSEGTQSIWGAGSGHVEAASGEVGARPGELVWLLACGVGDDSSVTYPTTSLKPPTVFKGLHHVL